MFKLFFYECMLHFIKQVSLISFSLFFLSLYIIPKQVNATTELLNDNFSDGNSIGWDEQNPWGSWTVQNEEYLGEATYQGSPAQPSYSTIGDESWTNYQLDLDINGIQGIDKQVLFRVNSDSNKAYIFNFRSQYFNGGNDALLAVRSPLGSEHATLLAAQSYTSNPNTWYHLTIQVQNQSDNSVKIKILINSQIIIDYADENNQILNGKIGLEVVPGGYQPNPQGLTTSTLYDNIVVSELLNSSLPVPLLKQTDPLWKDLEYDSAHLWSLFPTIERWGCALTSASMVLQYYHHNIFPDALNTWLNGQPDGYLGNGLLNWLAISRYTKQHESIDSPSLEYKRYTANTNILNSEISNSRPAILNVPGHFVVGTGIDSSDFFINDPAFSKTKLSQYPSFTGIHSYIPSQTDLSYILLLGNPELNISVYDNQNNSVGEFYIQVHTQIRSITLEYFVRQYIFSSDEACPPQ